MNNIHIYLKELVDTVEQIRKIQFSHSMIKEFNYVGSYYIAKDILLNIPTALGYREIGILYGDIDRRIYYYGEDNDTLFSISMNRLLTYNDWEERDDWSEPKLVVDNVYSWSKQSISDALDEVLNIMRIEYNKIKNVAIQNNLIDL